MQICLDFEPILRDGGYTFALNTWQIRNFLLRPYNKDRCSINQRRPTVFCRSFWQWLSDSLQIFFTNRSYLCQIIVQYLGNVISNLTCRFWPKTAKFGRFRPFLTVFLSIILAVVIRFTSNLFHEPLLLAAGNCAPIRSCDIKFGMLILVENGQK